MGCQSITCQGSKDKIVEMELITKDGDRFIDPIPSGYLESIGLSDVSKPPGGYGGKFSLPDGDLWIAQTSSLDVVKHIANLLSSKGLLEGWDQVGDIMYNSYSSRPGFIGGKLRKRLNNTSQPVKPTNIHVTPDVWGGAGWKMWHLLVNNFKEDSEMFFQYAKMLELLISEDKSPITGCESCSNNFQKFLKDFPIDSVTTPLKSALYSLSAHNEANLDKGKSVIPLKVAIYNYKWFFILDLIDSGEVNKSILEETTYSL